MDSCIGKMLDNRYELLELIGTGGMANVYKGRDHRLNRLVAIKILKSELAENAEFRRRFRDESLAVAALSHTNIVSVYDVSSSEGIEYIVMELIDGITLKQYMERRGQMDWREALHFITQIMHGLSHAHSRGIIHRDIKPQNIMVLRDGSVKVADFGIACLADAANTLTQEAIGSVHYISPEQARGDRTDARSDIYSAGVVLYEMLTGRLPFEGDNPVSVAIQHLSSMPLNPRDINPDIPEPMELICMKAMNPDLSKRYPSAAAMAEDLERYRKDPDVDLEYIRTEISIPSDDEPTMPLPKTEVSDTMRRQREQRRTGQEGHGRRHWLTASRRNTALLVGGIAAALVLIVVLFSLIAKSFRGSEPPSSYQVPGILGYTVEQAEQLEGVKGVFEIVVLGTRIDDAYTAGQIVAQEPAEGTVRKNNMEIKVYVCAEKEKIHMPNLVGGDYQNARIQLQGYDLQLKVDQSEEYSTEFARGQVMGTVPVAGAELSEGDTVTLVVSKGPAAVTVIPFVGMELDEAIRAAEELGLTVGTTLYRYSYEPEGQVIDQSLYVNDEVPGGTEIVFTVSGDYVRKMVQFSVPEQLEGKASVMVDFYMNGALVESTFLDYPNPADPVIYEFSGASGSTATVYAVFDGIQTETVEIYF